MKKKITLILLLLNNVEIKSVIPKEDTPLIYSKFNSESSSDTEEVLPEIIYIIKIALNKTQNKAYKNEYKFILKSYKEYFNTEITLDLIDLFKQPNQIFYRNIKELGIKIEKLAREYKFDGTFMQNQDEIIFYHTLRIIIFNIKVFKCIKPTFHIKSKRNKTCCSLI